MNYKHIYHAGGSADVFKHCVLVALLEALKRKETAFCYLETHAGLGLYDLQELNQILGPDKPKEYQEGIAKIIHKLPDFLELKNNHTFLKYLEIVQKNHFPHYYPGSPIIAASLLRRQDKAILIELHPEAHHELKQLFKSFVHQSDIAVHHQDGYLGMKAFLPPKEGRGLVFIDPAFEGKDEWENILTALILAFKKFKQGVYAVWYPIKDLESVDSFKNNLRIAAQNSNINDILFAEMTFYPNDAKVGLLGSGMAIVNPPWKLDSELQAFLPQIWRMLTWEGKGNVRFSN